MSGSYQNPISIRDAIRNIDRRKFLLPAIQRNFVWKTQQICALFDSLMRGYPVNSFMTWNVESKDIKDNFRFYGFLSHYCERFKESNDLVVTRGDFHDFQAVIDGQQRLTSMYIGLKGTYAFKNPRVWWPTTQDEKVLPQRKLYLNLDGPLDVEQNEGKLEYDFRFLTDKQVGELLNKEMQSWFLVGDILLFDQNATPDAVSDDLVIPYLNKRGWDSENKFARASLRRLYHVINKEKGIHYYQEESQEIDYVLDVFIRTNSGGTQLEFADLLMSIAVASWDGDARAEIDNLVRDCWQDASMGFSVDRDWVLKACLMLTDADVRFRVKNFDNKRVRTIQSRWPEIKACIKETLKLLKLVGLNDQAVRAKNAIIPIAYYLFQNGEDGKPRYARINNLAFRKADRVLISKWLNMALLKSVFGAQADAVLQKMREVISGQNDVDAFPLGAVVEEFKNTTRDLRFTEEYIEGLLRIEYGDPRCRSVLALLYPEINENLVFDMDHLHPSSAFKKSNLQEHQFLVEHTEKMVFYADSSNWNSVLNLHLISASQNKAKQDKSLSEWVRAASVGRAELLLSDETSLEFSEFQEFIEKRKESLTERLRANVFVTAENVEISEANMDDEQVSAA